MFSSAAEMKNIWRGRAGFMPPLQVSSTLSLNVISFVFYAVLLQKRRQGLQYKPALPCSDLKPWGSISWAMSFQGRDRRQKEAGGVSERYGEEWRSARIT